MSKHSCPFVFCGQLSERSLAAAGPDSPQEAESQVREDGPVIIGIGSLVVIGVELN